MRSYYFYCYGNGRKKDSFRRMEGDEVYAKPRAYRFIERICECRTFARGTSNVMSSWTRMFLTSEKCSTFGQMRRF